jgi:hypothetical protein
MQERARGFGEAVCVRAATMRVVGEAVWAVVLRPAVTRALNNGGGGMRGPELMVEVACDSRS